MDSYVSYLLSVGLHINCPLSSTAGRRWMLEQGALSEGRSRTLPAKSGELVHSKTPYVAPIESAFQSLPAYTTALFQSLLNNRPGHRGGLGAWITRRPACC